MLSLIGPVSAQDARRADDLAWLAEARARLVRQIVDLDTMIRRIEEGESYEMGPRTEYRLVPVNQQPQAWAPGSPTADR